MRKGGVRYSSPQSPGIGVSGAMASASSMRSSVGERELEEPLGVVDVLPLAQPRPDDHTADRGVLQHPAAGDVGNRDAVPPGHARGRRQHVLKPRPSAGRSDEAAVLHPRPGAGLFPVRLGLAEPAFGEPSAGHGAVGQQLHAGLEAQRRHRARRARVEQGERHLIGDDRNAARQRHVQVGGIDVGEAEVTDQPLVAQFLQEEQRVEPARIGVGPGVELQQIEPFGAEPCERTGDGGADVLARDRPRLGHPLGQQLDAAATGASAIEAGHVLGRAVVVGHVERRQPGLDIRPHRRRGGGEIDGPAVALHVGDLPQTGEDA